MLFKNTASQKVRVFAFDSATGLPKTGDAANITASISKDYGAFADLTDTSATEEDNAKAKGYYLFDISQAETNSDDIAITGRSLTSGVVVVGAPARMGTRPPHAGDLAINGSGSVTVSFIDSGALISSSFSPGCIDATAFTGTALEAFGGATWDEMTSSHSDFGSFGAAVVDKTGYSLASDGLDSIVVETAVNARQALSPILAAAAGKLSGATTGTIVIKGGNVTTTRITATTDADGNRTAVTLNLPT